MDGFYTIKENELVIPGVKGIREFIHISDTHISYCGENSSPEEKERAAKSDETWLKNREYFAGKFGENFTEKHRVHSYEALHMLIEYAKKEKPDKLLLSGDILDYPHGDGLEFLKKELDYYGGEYIFVPGNHEGRYERNQYLASLNNGKLGISEYEYDGFTIAAVDDCAGTVSDSTLARLKELSEGDVPVILLMHVPVATRENEKEMKQFENYYYISENSADANAREFVKLLGDKNSAVRGILCGHVHGYHVSYFSEGKKQICASSGLVGFVHRFTVRGE